MHYVLAINSEGATQKLWLKSIQFHLQLLATWYRSHALPLLKVSVCCQAKWCIHNSKCILDYAYIIQHHALVHWTCSYICNWASEWELVAIASYIQVDTYMYIIMHSLTVYLFQPIMHRMSTINMYCPISCVSDVCISF